MVTVPGMFIRKTFLFALFGVLWILISDALLLWLVPVLPQLSMWQTAKGWLYVAVSTGVFYFLLTAAHRREQQAKIRQTEAEAAFIASEARFRRLAENAQDLIYRYDFLPQPHFSYVSPSALQMTGYSPQDHYDDPDLGYKLVHPEDRHLLKATTDEWLIPGKLLRLRWVHKDGRILWTEQRNTPIFDDCGALVALEGIARDVTEQIETELALEESEKRFRKAIEEAPLPVIIHAEDGEVLSLSRTWTDITGYQATELPTIADWTRRAYGNKQEAVQRCIQRLYTMDRRIDEGEYEIVCHDGMRRVWAFSSTPLGQIADGRRIVISMAMDVTERREAESRLQLQSAALEAAANAIVITDVNGNLEWLNAAFSALTGYTQEEALGKNPRELLKSGKQSPEFYKALWQTILSGQVWQGEIINRRKDHSLYTEEASITPVRNKDGIVTHFIAVKQDISQRKQADNALQESESRYRSLFEHNLMVMLLIDPQDGRIIDANHAAASFYGWSREALKRKKIGDINTLSPSEVQREMERARGEERNYFHFRHQLADGRIRNVEVSSGPVLVDGRSLLYSTVIDVTERRETEQEREQLLAQVQTQAEQLAQIMHSVPEGVCLLDPDGLVLVANPRAEANLLLLANAGVGDQLTEVGERPLASLLTSPPRGEWHRVEKSGRIFQIIAQPVESGPISQGWVMVIWEVTEQQMLQRQLQRQERLAVVGQLAAGIAHDFNNILAVIVLYSQTLQASANLAEGEKNRLAVIDQQAKRASQLVQQVLDFSRQSVMMARPLDLLPLLKEEIKLLKRTLPAHITIKLIYTEHAFFVRADPTRLQQVVMNLALNARDAMPDGGQLLFEASQIEVANKKQEPLPQMDPGKWLQLRVTDTGSGIDPNSLDHVFEPFFTTKSPGKGNGLGLAQVHGIVGQHGGQITVESQEGKGTTFTIYLPAFELEAQPIQTDSTAAQLDIPQGNGESVLVVEDNEALREALTEGLTGWNYNVVAAEDGVEALQFLETHSGKISLIISDMVMPRMGGSRLLRALNEQGWSIPVIFLTGHPNNDVEAGMQREGVVATMLKPVDMVQLAQTMATLLASA